MKSLIVHDTYFESMPGKFFTLMIDDQVTTFERRRILSIEPYENGTKIILEASHSAEEPIIYFSNESYDKVMQAYLA